MSFNSSMWQENSESIKSFAFAKFSEVPGECSVLCTLVLFMFLASLMGNAFVTLSIWTNPALHSPMYFFLTKLTVLEISYTCSVIPKMLQSLVSEARGISQEDCATQMFFFSFLVSLSAASWQPWLDHYIAICAPLHYVTRMGHGVRTQVAMVSWGMGCTVGLVLTRFVFSLDFCGPCEIDHSFCDLPTLLALLCGNAYQNEIAIFVAAVLCISSPFLQITASYGRILAAVLAMPSAEVRHKALSTCFSHRFVVTLFYGSTFTTYFMTKSSHSPRMDKLLTLFYTAVTSMMNPIIYTLQNKEVQAALWRTQGLKKCSDNGEVTEKHTDPGSDKDTRTAN